MSSPVAGLVEQLRASPTLERCGQHLLYAALAQLRRTLAEASDPHEADAEPLRAVLFLRKQGELENLVIADLGAPGGQTLVAPSTSAWAALREDGQPLALDIDRGWLHPVGAPAPRASRHGQPSQRTLTLFSARSATHAMVLPVRSQGRLHGMVVLELSAPAMQGRPLTLWARIAPLVQRELDAATPLILERAAQDAPIEPDPLLPIVGRAMANRVAILRKLAPYDVPILLSGESGTGKTHLAEWVHLQSKRKQHPFVSVDIAGLPDNLVDGTLFGWRAGSFTGARGDRPGLVEQARHGTLFIDDIDRLPLDVQDKLLRLVDCGRYRVLGEGVESRAELRVIAGTNADLQDKVRRGEFRHDLLHRLGTVRIVLPPLRERRDELADWARQFLETHHREREGQCTVQVTDAALMRLEREAWPGNLRQLYHVMGVAWVLAHEPDSPLVVDEPHVDQALSLGAASDRQDTVLAHLRAAARVFVDHCQRAQQRGQPLPPLDDGKAFKAAVWAEACERLGTREGFLLLGEERMVEGRNHGRALSRELGRLAHLAESLGEEPPGER